MSVVYMSILGQVVTRIKVLDLVIQMVGQRPMLIIQIDINLYRLQHCTKGMMDG
ncbi:hypothetical protein ElyMa_005705700 [Elysia marginata]|uniref:Uncharacterized protein n=1 Tax=Elysia marginata TaxID=1093978 RepID=A0AAV4FGI6_9GAST|nr:hypothetical protein ElyMa_005705700 [Elysia marginata]